MSKGTIYSQPGSNVTLSCFITGGAFKKVIIQLIILTLILILTLMLYAAPVDNTNALCLWHSARVINTEVTTTLSTSFGDHLTNSHIR